VDRHNRPTVLCRLGRLIGETAAKELVLNPGDQFSIQRLTSRMS
jgi:hypothetical protein